MDPELFCVEDFERVAERKISPENFAFYAAGTVGGVTVKENCEAYKRWRFRPRLLRDVSRVRTETTVLNSKIAFPICVSPTALLRRAHKDAEVAVAKATESLGTGFTLSMFSNCTMTEVGEAAPNGILWCHLQILSENQLTEDLVRQAEKCGFRGFVVTIDQPVLSKRRYMTRDGKPFQFKYSKCGRGTIDRLKEKYHPRDVQGDFFYHLLDASITWEGIDWLKTITKLPVMVKGVQTAEMALEAIQHNVDGIIVSNHGGRQLDSCFATIDVLPEVIRAVSGRCDVFVDGGIRSGSDVAKAIALGAKAVFVGRPAIWGLACDGEKGARKVLEILRDELILTMQLLGVSSLEELRSTPNLIVHETWRHSNL